MGRLPSTRKQAREEGAEFYFTGRACKHGHSDKRRVSTKRCLSCEEAVNARMGAERKARRRAGEFTTVATCKYGHTSERYVSGGSCQQCATIRRRERRFLSRILDVQIYESDKPCRKGHYTRFGHNGFCVECVRARDRKRAQARERKDHVLRWQKENPHKARANNKRSRAARRNAVPPWADNAVIDKIYEGCPDGHQVDHIVPIQGDAVSGLHVEANLQYLTKEANSGKKNRFTPVTEYPDGRRVHIPKHLRID